MFMIMIYLNVFEYVTKKIIQNEPTSNSEMTSTTNLAFVPNENYFSLSDKENIQNTELRK